MVGKGSRGLHRCLRTPFLFGRVLKIALVTGGVYSEVPDKWGSPLKYAENMLVYLFLYVFIIEPDRASQYMVSGLIL